MSEKKDNNDQHKAWRVEDDAYDELLNSYFSTDEKKTVRKNTIEPIEAHKPKAEPKKSNGFKLEIKDLDNEFNAPIKKEKTVKQGIPRSDLYKKAAPEKRAAKPPKMNAQRPSHTDSKPQNHDKKLDDTLDFLPAFSFDGTAEKRAEVKPVYYNAEKADIPQAKKPPRAKKEQIQKPAAKAKTQSSKKHRNTDGQEEKPYKSINQNDAVIIKKNNLPPQKRLLMFIKQNKKAWVLIAVCIACAVLISTYAISCMNDILAINRDSENVVTINLPADTNTKGAIKILKDNGLIKHELFCRLVAKVVEYRDDNYLTGIYYLTESMGLENMLSSFKESPITGETVTLVFPEGFSVDQIAEKLARYEVCSTTAFYTTMSSVDFSSEYSFIAEEDNKERRYRLLEGYLYPDTYEFYIGENASSVIRKFLDNFKSKWTDEYTAQAQKLGMSVDDVITLASIIEKEAYGADQMPSVSSVLHNRLNRSGLYPTLQCDSTTAYFNDYIAKNVTDSAAQSRFMQDYSTYRCEGLPVGAICNPGNDAIYGALFPATTSYYYFLHDDNKKLYLAANDAEHQANGIAALRANRAAAAN